MASCPCAAETTDSFSAAWLVGLAEKTVPSVLGVLVGALITGYFLNKYFVRRANIAALVERICDELDALRDDCGEYWSADYDDAKADVAALLESKIKARNLYLGGMVALAAIKHKQAPDDLRVQLFKLMDHCTGGLFESKQRKADRRRYMKIVSSINKIAVELQKFKI
jgi:hypothetical protein